MKDGSLKQKTMLIYESLRTDYPPVKRFSMTFMAWRSSFVSSVFAAYLVNSARAEVAQADICDISAKDKTV